MVAAVSGGGNGERTEEVEELDESERRKSEALGVISASLVVAVAGRRFWLWRFALCAIEPKHSIQNFSSFSLFVFYYFI